MNLNKIAKDKKTLGFIALCLIIESFHIYQLVDSGFMIQPLIRVSFYPILIITTLFFDKKAIPYVVSGFALALTLTITFDNFTPYILLIICCMVVRSKTYDIIMLSLYTVCIAIVCHLHGKDSIHIILHIGGCVLIFLLGKMLNLSIKSLYKPKDTNLDLTNEEHDILRQVAIEGKTLKEVGNPNTISKKINTCYKKNNLNNSKDLYEIYKIQFLSNKYQIQSNKSNDTN